MCFISWHFWLLLLMWQQNTNYSSYSQVNQVELKHLTMIATLCNFDTQGSTASHDWSVTAPKIREISDFGGHFFSKEVETMAIQKNNRSHFRKKLGTSCKHKELNHESMTWQKSRLWEKDTVIVREEFYIVCLQRLKFWAFFREAMQPGITNKKFARDWKNQCIW